MNYGKIFNDKVKLREVLLREALKGLKEEDLEDSILDRVPEFVEQHVENGAPEYMIIDFLEGTLDFCTGCEGAPCCTKNDPIAISYEDVKRLAKGFGKSSKYVIKRYLTHYNPVEIPGICYKVKRASPCQWLGEGYKCTIYESRPKVCRLYPLTLSLSKSKAGKNELTAGVSSYCNVAFNMLKLGVERKAIRENFMLTKPEEFATLEQAAAKTIPARESLEAIPQMERARLLRIANTIFYKGVSDYKRKEERNDGIR
jgi:Fe-S-cluster containining protein